MAGLLGSGGAGDGMTMKVGPASPAPAGGGQADPSRIDDSDEQGQQPNVTPEEQAQYDAFVSNGLKVIYGQSGASAEKAEGPEASEGPQDPEPAVRPDILNRLKESSDPLENLANTTVWLVTMLETSAEKGGTQLDDAVVMHGGKAMLEELAEVSEAAGIHDYSEKEMEGAWYRGLDLYRETATQDGRVDPESLKEQFGEIQRADEQGRMGDVLPQMGTEADGKTPTPPQATNQTQGSM